MSVGSVVASFRSEEAGDLFRQHHAFISFVPKELLCHRGFALVFERRVQRVPR